MEQILDIKQLKQDEMIDRYLKNQMTTDEETEFEALLKSDAELRSRARFVALTIKAMKQADNEEGLMIAPASGFRRVAKNPLVKPKKK